MLDFEFKNLILSSNSAWLINQAKLNFLYILILVFRPGQFKEPKKKKFKVFKVKYRFNRYGTVMKF